ncbi:MAG TPA: MauE/DoxX family redox-associated membrane protein [Spirochaetia bacterium]|nr:MauE/DoxX family redox-associated membrane protein [Spirochaetia bacterium]
MLQGRSTLPWLGLAIRVAAAAVWLVAGLTKLPDLAAFPALVERYDILPRFLAEAFAYALPFFEIGLGLYLAAGLFVRASALIGTALFALFLAAQAQAWLRGLPLDCGCFGTISRSTVGPGTIARDFLLGIPTFLMLAFPARKLSLDRRLFGARDSFGAP